MFCKDTLFTDTGSGTGMFFASFAQQGPKIKLLGTVAVLVGAAARSIFDRRGAKSLTGVEGAALDLGVGNK